MRQQQEYRSREGTTRLQLVVSLLVHVSTCSRVESRDRRLPKVVTTGLSTALTTRHDLASASVNAFVWVTGIGNESVEMRCGE